MRELTITSGDIGEEPHEVEFEPLDEPAAVPVPVPVPAVPVEPRVPVGVPG